jgi:hypothetical protein
MALGLYMGMRIRNTGLRALTTSKERAELRAIKQLNVRLKYHKGSERMSMRTMKGELIDARLWDVLSPKLPGYVYNADSGPVTLSTEGLKRFGLI